MEQNNNSNNNVKKTKTPAPKPAARPRTEDALKEKDKRIAELEAENANLREENDRFRDHLEEMAEGLSRTRIAEKDRYVAKMEQDCDDKLANKDLIIDGLNRNIARLTEQARANSVRMMNMQTEIDRLTRGKKGFFARIFGTAK